MNEVPQGAGPPGPGTMEALREANQQLVLASLRAAQEVDAALRALADAARDARIDSLTALPNDLLLQERFTAALSSTAGQARKLAVLSVGLDDFARINFARGHAAGDSLLVHGADALRSATRSIDTVSRHGGDQFAILLTDVASRQDVADAVRKLHAAISVPYTSDDGERVQMSASIGVSMFPEHGGDLRQLLLLSLRARHVAARHGPGQVVFHGDPTEDAILAGSAVPAAISAIAELTQWGEDGTLMRDVNEQLVLAVISVQELHDRAEYDRQRQREFLAVVAHELRNPLAPMRNVSSALSLIEPADATLVRLQGIIERQVQHMSRLIDDLMDASRIATGKLALDMQPVTLDDVVTESVDTTRDAVQRRRQQLTIIAAAEPVQVIGDRVRLTQIVTNLLDNASKYTPEDGTIEVHLRSNAETVSVTVCDSGIGIARAALPRIFDLFQQEPNAVGFNSAGLGIGLTVVRELTEAHGGSVEARNRTSGIGSEFVITLPRSDAPSAPAISTPVAQP